MKENKIKTSLLSLTLEPRNKSLVRWITTLLSEKTIIQNKRWAGFNDNLDFDDSSHEYPEISVPGNQTFLETHFHQENAYLILLHGCSLVEDFNNFRLCCLAASHANTKLPAAKYNGMTSFRSLIVRMKKNK